MNDRPSNPMLTLLAAGVIGMTVLVVWSCGSLFTQRVEYAPSQPTQQEAQHHAPKAGPSEETIREEASSASTAPAPLAEDPLMKLIHAALKRPHAVPNEAILSFRTRGELAQFLRDASKWGLKIVGTLDAFHAVRVAFDNESALHGYMASAGKNAPALEANQWMTVPQIPKTDGTNQGGAVPVGEKLMSSINALGDRTQWGKGVTVAVLDTGVKAHPTFGEGQITHVDLVNDGKPFHSHGTSVASLIAGQDDRVPGVAPDTSIIDIRVANEQGISVSSVLAQGIVEAVDRGANIINISLGGYDSSEILSQAVAYALSKKVFVVAAAGNESYNQLAYPAAIPRVISVGSVDGNNQQAYFSNSGSTLKITAPGVGLQTAWDTNKLAIVSGTSQSTAVVSGVIAANYSLGVTYDNMLNRLQTDSKATGSSPDKVGSGVVQVTKH